MIVDDPNFKPEQFAVACHIVCNGEILYVKRNTGRSQGGKWGSIAGKREEGEDNLNAIKREVKEEIGLEFKDDDYKYVGTWKVKFNSQEKKCNYKSFTYYLYRVEIKEKPEIILSEDESKEYNWFTPQEALEQELFQDEDGVLRDIYGL